MQCFYSLFSRNFIYIYILILIGYINFFHINLKCQNTTKWIIFTETIVSTWIILVILLGLFFTKNLKIELIVNHTIFHFFS